MQNLIIMWNRFFHNSGQLKVGDWGLLFFRVSVGLMMALSHGLGKIQVLISGDEIQFADPIGIGTTLSFVLAAGAEFMMSSFIVLGFATRLAALPVMFTMTIAAFVVHANDPFQKQEFALIYLICFSTIFLLGPGKYSLDKYIRSRFF